jgi:hypothetical protein
MSKVSEVVYIAVLFCVGMLQYTIPASSYFSSLKVSFKLNKWKFLETYNMLINIDI